MPGSWSLCNFGLLFCKFLRGAIEREERMAIGVVEAIYRFKYLIFRWFKFTLKPPNSMAHGNFFLAIWDTSH